MIWNEFQPRIGEKAKGNMCKKQKEAKTNLHYSSADEASKLKSMCFYGDYFKGQETKAITCSTCETMTTNSIETSVITVTVPTNMTTETPTNWIAEV